MAAVSVTELPEGDEWLSEVKLDGSRSLLLKDVDIRLISREQNDLTRSYPSIVKAARRIQAEQAILDGEIIAQDEQGKPSFQALQHRTSCRATILYVAFDLLNLQGTELRSQPLVRRRELLQRLVKGTGIQFSEPIAEDPDEALQFVIDLKLEGVVSKAKTIGI